ncbi:hypothetical protein [Deinococcus sp.]|uniref:hypothetical protein n=1 Tax=Deinococcus sp. TaxID=47478 RepID=UPI0025F2CCEA|nr:hypothetical protein [Deinococcus sp.]
MKYVAAALALLLVAFVGLLSSSFRGRALIVGTMRNTFGTPQDKTLAGADADRNGIRDDVDELIAREYHAWPIQKTYAERLAKIYQIEATTKRLTRQRAISLIKTEVFNLICFSDSHELNRFGSSNEKLTWSVFSKQLANLTFNTLERRRNKGMIGPTAGPSEYVLPKDKECKFNLNR